jgi:diguanylate cyclase (GGDEF)-like protein
MPATLSMMADAAPPAGGRAKGVPQIGLQPFGPTADHPDMGSEGTPPLLSRAVPPILVAGSVLSVITVVVPGYLRPGWGVAVELGTGAASLVTAWVMARGVSAVVLLAMALGADATLAGTAWCQAEPKAAIALFALPTLTVALFGSSRLLLVQTPAAILGSAAILFLAGEPWPVLALHVVTAAYATSSPAAVVIVLRRRLDRALDREHELATTDPLTGLLNRRGLEARTGELVARAARRGVSLGVIVADVDHFKRVNDQHGHLVGDEVLRQVAHAVRACVRADDLVVRLGGEEFAVVLVLDPPDLTEVGKRILREVPRRCTPTSVTLSIGLAWDRPAVGDEEAAVNKVWALVDQADDLMFEAKRAGRNRMRTPDDTLPDLIPTPL